MTKFRVKPFPKNLWGVFRNSHATPVATFVKRIDAIEHANELAEAEPGVTEVVVELV